jgi:glycerol-3-phosphate dehydrogenase
MKRDIEQLSSRQYDILVIGGGIYGACVLWDAALRGLSAALVEKADFGHATSANSLKIIHGGLRYLQDFSLRRVRTMARERNTWLRIAPHFIQPLPCLMPTGGKAARSRAVMGMGLRLNDLVSHDRNDGLEPERTIPAARLLSREECVHLLPGLDHGATTGGALWYDGQVTNTERLLLTIIRAATEAGATAANYVEVTDLIQNGAAVEGVTAVDTMTGQCMEIRAAMVVNCAGEAASSLAHCLSGGSAMPHLPPSVAANVLTRRLHPSHAVAIPASPASSNGNGPAAEDVYDLPSTLFVVPWQEYSLIGTLHLPAERQMPRPVVSATALQTLLAAVNHAWPAANLSLEDVRHVQAGFLPAHDYSDQDGQVQLVRDSRVFDHQALDGVSGLITVAGVKYTTARHTAEQVVDIASRRVTGQVLPCRTHTVPVAPHIQNWPSKQDNGLERPAMRHLQANYGVRYTQVLDYVAPVYELDCPVDDDSPVLGGEVVHAVRQEMALRLSDAVCRRTVLGAAGLPSEAALHRCAALMGAELGWSERRKAEEIEAVYHYYADSRLEAV